MSRWVVLGNQLSFYLLTICRIVLIWVLFLASHVIFDDITSYWENLHMGLLSVVFITLFISVMRQVKQAFILYSYLSCQRGKIIRRILLSQVLFSLVCGLLVGLNQWLSVRYDEVLSSYLYQWFSFEIVSTLSLSQEIVPLVVVLCISLMIYGILQLSNVCSLFYYRLSRQKKVMPMIIIIVILVALTSALYYLWVSNLGVVLAESVSQLLRQEVLIPVVYWLTFFYFILLIFVDIKLIKLSYKVDIKQGTYLKG